MSLVIGYADAEIGFLAADTLLSFKFGETGEIELIGGQVHTLKIWILNERNAVAFAGNNAPLAIELLNRLLTLVKTGPDIDASKELVSLATIHCGNRLESEVPDFLILQLTAFGPKLSKIKQRVLETCNRAYVGDQEEYKRFTQLAERFPYAPANVESVQQPDGTFITRPLKNSDGEIYFGTVADALEKLTAQWNSGGSVGAVSAGITRVCNARISGNLEYLQSITATTSPAEPASGYHWLASNKAPYGMALYYPLGKMGFVFRVGDSGYCRKEYANTKERFAALASEKYGLNLE